MTKVAGVVVLYEPESKDFENIKTYIDDIDFLIIMDNSAESNQSKIPKDDKIEYIWNHGNIGLAPSLNIACKQAIEKQYLWILTLDQDSKFEDHMVQKLKMKLPSENSEYGIVTPWHQTKLDIQKPKEEIDFPLTVMTSGNFLNLTIYQKIGGFRDDFFIDGVDIEYCLRLKKNNYKIMRFNEFEMKHELGNIQYRKLLGRTYMCTNHNYIRNYYMARNYHYIKKEYKKVAVDYCNTLVKYKGIMFKIMMFEKDKYRKIRNIYRGIFDYHRHITGKYRFKN